MKSTDNEILNRCYCVFLIIMLIFYPVNSRSILHQLNADDLFVDNISNALCENFTECSSVPLKYADYFTQVIQYCEGSKKSLILLTQYSVDIKSLSRMNNDTLTRRLYAIKYSKSNIEKWSFVIVSNLASTPNNPIINYSHSFNGGALSDLPFKKYRPGIEYRNKQPFAYFKRKPSLNDLKKFLKYDPLKWRITVDSAKGEKLLGGVVIEENWRKLFNAKPLPLFPQQ